MRKKKRERMEDTEGLRKEISGIGRGIGVVNEIQDLPLSNTI